MFVDFIYPDPLLYWGQILCISLAFLPSCLLVGIHPGGGRAKTNSISDQVYLKFNGNKIYVVGTTIGDHRRLAIIKSESNGGTVCVNETVKQKPLNQHRDLVLIYRVTCGPRGGQLT